MQEGQPAVVFRPAERSLGQRWRILECVDLLLRYTGAFTDPNTNLTKLGHRYYKNSQGRFTQEDTITKPADTENGNRYLYASCNPLSDVDPTGQFPKCVKSALAGGLAGAIRGLAGSAATAGTLSLPATVGEGLVGLVGGWLTCNLGLT
jgi:RHS repeat-associated protein